MDKYTVLGIPGAPISRVNLSSVVIGQCTVTAPGTFSEWASTMAKIEGFRVKNYGVLGDLTLGKLWNLPKARPLIPMTAVIGKNGVGKSTLFDAFGFLADCLRLGIEKACDAGGRGGFERMHSGGSGRPHRDSDLLLRRMAMPGRLPTSWPSTWTTGGVPSFCTSGYANGVGARNTDGHSRSSCSRGVTRGSPGKARKQALSWKMRETSPGPMYWMHLPVSSKGRKAETPRRSSWRTHVG